MPEADGEINLVGNLFPRDPNSSLFEQTSGYDAFLRLEVSTRAVLVGLESNEELLNKIKANTDLIPATL